MTITFVKRSSEVRSHSKKSSSALRPGELDALSLAIFTDRTLQRSVRSLGKVDLEEIRNLTERSFERLRAGEHRVTAQPIEVHKRVMSGFGGTALLISSAMLLDTLSEAERYFHVSFKTLKARLDQQLEPGPSELALRMARATLAASDVFGNMEAARKYLRTRNFALGGAAPVDLLQTAEGERIVLNELQAQAEGGPL